MDTVKTAEEARNLLRSVLDGIEQMSVVEREKLLRWADSKRDLGMWAVPGVEVMIGIHNKCVLEIAEKTLLGMVRISTLPIDKPHAEVRPE